jgi:L-amino acid N-acyltransferase YncA
MIVRNALVSDAQGITEIYNHYISTSIATFEIKNIKADVVMHRIQACLTAGYIYLVSEDQNEIVGYAYAHQYRPRPAYDRTVEVSVYTKSGCEHRGIASALYEALIPAIFKAGFHTILAGIALPNEASVRFHEKFGFQKVAHFSEVGRKFDRWIDVGYWQLTDEIDRSRHNHTDTRDISDHSF